MRFAERLVSVALVLSLVIAVSVPISLTAAAPPVVGAQQGNPLPPGAIRRFGSDRFRFAGYPIASALSPDGNRLAVLAMAWEVHQAVLTVFEADTGKPICRGSVESASHFAPPGLAFSPNGKYIAAAIAPDVQVVLAADTGQLVRKLPGSQGYGLSQFTPDGLLACTEGNRTSLVDIPSGVVKKTWPVGRILRLTPDAKTFVRLDPEFSRFALGDLASGVTAWTLPVKLAKGPTNGLAFSPDGTKLAVVQDRTHLQVWDVATRRKESEVAIPEDVIGQFDSFSSVAFSPDGATIALFASQGRIARWQTASFTSLPRLEAARAGDLGGVHWTKDGRTILVPASNGCVHRWDAKSGKRFPDEGYNGRVRFGLTPDGARLVVCDHAGRLDVQEVATGRLVRQLDKGRDKGRPLVCLAVAPDGRRVAVGEGHCEIRIFPIDGGNEARRIMTGLRLDGGWMSFLAWSPDGKNLFSSGSGMVLCRTSLADGETVWARPDEEFLASALRPDGAVVAGTRASGIGFLRASDGKPVSAAPLARTPDQTDFQFPLPRALTFAPDGRQLALVLGACTVALCDGDGRELRRFPAAGSRPVPAGLSWKLRVPGGGWKEHHTVEALAFSPDGKWLVSGADDLTVKVWETATGRLVARFDGHGSVVEQVAVAPDGRSAFSAGQDGFVYQWDLTPRPARPARKPDELWVAAADPDPAVAVPAAWALVRGSDEARAFVARRLLADAEGASTEQVAKWLAALDAPEFAVREEATRALAAQGRRVEHALRATVLKPSSLEVRRRAKQLLAELEKSHTPAELRALRVVQACEVCATPATRALLRRWAAGTLGTVLTEDARAALARLDRRPK
jgi:WD40 repeat protein